MIRKIACLLIIVFFLGCHMINEPRYKDAPGTWDPRNGFSQWFLATGSFKYGITPEDVEAILAKESFCGEKFVIKKIEWPLKNQKPPTTGPYFGIYHVQGEGLSPNFCALLIGNGKFLEYGALFTLAGVQWMPLLGHPDVIDCVMRKFKENMSQEKYEKEIMFGKTYWYYEKEIKSFLSAKHSEQELDNFMSNLIAKAPSNLITYSEAKEDHQIFRKNEHQPQRLIECEVERNNKWDKIMAIRLFQDSFYAKLIKESAAVLNDWGYNLFANIYIKDGQIVAVIVEEPNFYDCPPSVFLETGHCPGAEWYPISTSYCWTYD
jgi:hypothetical protein